MDVLTVKDLCKTYPAFKLQQVSFELEQGKITGFIGRNGAGKTTTLKSLFNFVHPDSGEISFFGLDFAAHELEIKQRIGFVSGGVNFYPRKKLKTITAVTRQFYPSWDDNAYRNYLQRFNLNEEKTPAQLSAGMKVKYALTLALSHNAELLILDEPTSGLDPVSRDELLDIFMDLCDRGVTIFFSTHITSDLDKCADNIIYIQNGHIRAAAELSAFVASYRIVGLQQTTVSPELKNQAFGVRRTKRGCSLLLRADQELNCEHTELECDLEAIMVHMEKEGERHE